MQVLKQAGPSGLMALVLLLAPAGPLPARAQWPQWGGPNRNFTVETEGLADSWPKDGPKRLWRKSLGDGYSAIVVDDGLLYTMYRRGRRLEYVAALDAQTGEIVWKHKSEAPLPRETDGSDWGGGGPNSTPLIAGDRLLTVGSHGQVRCFDKKSGSVFWEHDLVAEFNAGLFRNTGYSCSPIAVRNLIVVPAGRPPAQDSATAANPNLTSQTLIAFEQSSGSVAWKSVDLEMGFASPILIRFDGQEHLVAHTKEGLIGVNPLDGKLLWQHPAEGWIASPVWNGKDLLFCISGFDDATGHLIRLAKKAGKVEAEELWNSRRTFVGQPTPVLVGACLVGATKQNLVCVSVATGKRLWVERGFPMASCVYGDGKLIILDENGQLTLATATPTGLTVHSQCKVTRRYSFTAPTLVGTTLYVRDRKHIMALDLG